VSAWKLARLALCAAVVALLIVLILEEGPHENREGARGLWYTLAVAFAGGFLAGSFWALIVVPIAMFAANEAYRSIHDFPDAPREITGFALVSLLVFLLAALAVTTSAGVLASNLLQSLIRRLYLLVRPSAS